MLPCYLHFLIIFISMFKNAVLYQSWIGQILFLYFTIYYFIFFKYSVSKYFKKMSFEGILFSVFCFVLYFKRTVCFLQNKCKQPMLWSLLDMVELMTKL